MLLIFDPCLKLFYLMIYLVSFSMSTGPSMQATSFVQGNQSRVEHDAPHSALFYLFQEVSKLTSPVCPGSVSFLDTCPSSIQLNETSRKDPLVVKKRGEDTQSLPPVLLCDQLKKVKKEGPGSNVTTLNEPHCECKNPGKVLSLINLHCEKLLHQGDAEELESCSVSSAIRIHHSTIKSSTAERAVPEGEVKSDSVGAQCTLRDASLSPVEDTTEDGYKLQCCVKDSEMNFRVQLQPAEKTDTVGAELLVHNAAASLQSEHGCKKEIKSSVNSQLKGKQEHNQDCCATELDILDVPLHQNSLSQTHIPDGYLNAQLTSKSNDETCVALSKPALRLDHNANLTLFIEPPCDIQLPAPCSVLSPSRSESLIFSNAENFHSLLTQDDKTTASKAECTHDPKEEKHRALAELQSSSCNVSSATSKPELLAQEEEVGIPSSHQWRIKTPRKQPHPSRSADIQDPDFQGVIFRMDTELDDSREQCRLLITSKYSKVYYICTHHSKKLCKSARKPRLKTRTSQKSLKICSSDDEKDLTANVFKSKVCASCCTRKTPMWRDAEDGTPLCNACGIRYKKYRVRCVNCWHIPRKEGNSSSSCLKCGNFVRLTSAQRKHTT
ncbi:GATA-type zinc finger protein 1 [Acanthochromis polyacanthus]|uniref:GATA-type zinc finger protein 1 n=1 Tax=Acanthochromis polyacanthus TaxID=80966 RepID=UPI0022343E82|nr:GATA-type zinc finger protein 1 [Acanthochromis polyacanthus]